MRRDGQGRPGKGRPTPTAPSREEASGQCVGAGFLASGFHAGLPAFPGFPSGLRHDARRIEARLSGYSGGTAQALDLLPFSPSNRGAPRRLPGV